MQRAAERAKTLEKANAELLMKIDSLSAKSSVCTHEMDVGWTGMFMIDVFGLMMDCR